MVGYRCHSFRKPKSTSDGLEDRDRGVLGGLSEGSTSDDSIIVTETELRTRAPAY